MSLCTDTGSNLNALYNSGGEFSVNLHFLTVGPLNRLHFRSACCLIQYFSQNLRFSQTELCPRLQISLYAFGFIKFCGSCCPFLVSYTAHPAGYVTVHTAGLLLPILCVSYCPFCVSPIAHSAGSVTIHLAGLLLTTLCVSYCQSFGVCYCPFCRVYYCPYCGSITVYTGGLLLPIPCQLL